MPATLNAANEIAVQAFLDGKIRLSDIPKIIESVMNEHETQKVADLETVLEADKTARKQAIMKLENLENCFGISEVKSYAANQQSETMFVLRNRFSKQQLQEKIMDERNAYSKWTTVKIIIEWLNFGFFEDKKVELSKEKLLKCQPMRVLCTHSY